MLIGQVARASGASIKAIRLYEQIGLIPTPPRLGRYRFYDRVSVEMLRCIKQAQLLGFSLQEIRQLIDPASGLAVDRFEQAIDHKLAQLRERIAQAEQRAQALLGLKQQVMNPEFCKASA